jgi:hypothetical protein
MDFPTDQTFMFPPLVVEKKSGEEYLTNHGRELEVKLSDFWKWAVSDLVSNATRGIFAEFIAANAIGKISGIRQEWDAFDLKLMDGTKVEVKSTAYHQSWAQQRYSRPEFAIKTSCGWNAETNMSSSESKRQADIYVFCLLKEKDRSQVNPLNLNQWEFFLIEAAVLNKLFPTQKKIGLNRLLSIGPVPASYTNLAAELQGMAERLRDTNRS